MFDSSNIKATLEGVSLDTKKERGSEEDGKQYFVLVVLHFSVDLDENGDLAKDLEKDFFPGMVQMEERTLNQGGSYTILLTAKWKHSIVKVYTKPPELRKDNARPIFYMPAASVKGKPKAIIMDGKTCVEVQFREEIDAKQFSALSKYLESDLYMSCAPSQTEIPGTSAKELAAANQKAKEGALGEEDLDDIDRQGDLLDD